MSWDCEVCGGLRGTAGYGDGSGCVCHQEHRQTDGAKTADSVVEAVKSKFDARSRRGIIKYGVTLDRNDLTVEQWLLHAQEEAMDFALYLERLIQEQRRTVVKKSGPQDVKA